MALTRDLWFLPPDYLNIPQGSFADCNGKLASCHCRAKPTFTRFGKAEIDKFVFGKVWVENDVTKAPLAAICDCWNAINIHNRALILPQLQFALLFGHKGIWRVGHKRHGPWLIEVRNDCDVKRLPAGVGGGGVTGRRLAGCSKK